MRGDRGVSGVDCALRGLIYLDEGGIPCGKQVKFGRRLWPKSCLWFQENTQVFGIVSNDPFRVRRVCLLININHNK